MQIVLLFLVVGFFLSSCRDDISIRSNNNTKLIVKADTIYFDTVFTQVAPGTPMSVNKQFVLVNPYDEIVQTSVTLAGGKQSIFKLNVDGQAGYQLSDIEILPKDSVFVFVELYAPQTGQNLPLIYRDSLHFVTNGNLQKVQLAAWGQDAHYFLGDTLKDHTTWVADKPYVISKYLFVPEGKTLQIQEGVQLHMAPYSWLYVEGKLEILGKANNRILIQGDRLEPRYEEQAGQYGGIWLSYPSKQNRIEYTTIKNGTVGVYVDTSSSDGETQVQIKNSFIRNMRFDGVAAKGGTLDVQNCLITDCGRVGFLGQLGGSYRLKHNTITNYASGQGSAVLFNNIERDENGFPTGLSFDIDFLVQNCIISGYAKDELILDIDPLKQGSSIVSNSLIKADELFDVFNKDDLKNKVNRLSFYPNFVDISNFDYSLDSLSPAIDAGQVLNPVITEDYNNNLRSGIPDAGAIEKQ